MTRRPRSHQLETESRTSFSASLPSGWLFRDLVPDYGLDGIVEIFDERGVATGHLFFVQLKATDEPSIDRALGVRIDTRNLDYYSTLVLPVLLVVFHSQTSELYARWVNSTPAPYDADTATIRLSLDDRWTPDKHRGVLRDLESVRTTMIVGNREVRIQRYYDLKRAVNPADKPTGPSHPILRFRQGERVLHGVFGQGTVDEYSDNYLFVQFDGDDLLRKFNPGDTWEFTRLKAARS